MKIVDFNKDIKHIYTQLIDSHKNLPIHIDNQNINNDIYYEYYKSLIDTRHDLLHYTVLKSMGRNWQEEQPMCNFVKDIPEEWSRKTPDIFIEYHDHILICDVSITYDIAKSLKLKIEKYQKMCDWINEHVKKCIFIHLNIKSDSSNLNEELVKLSNYMIRDFDTNFYSKSRQILKDKLDYVDQCIDKEYFDRRKKEEMLKKDNNIDHSYFKDELKYVNIGRYNDIDIELETFQEYNKQFTIMDLIEKRKDEYNFEETCLMFKEILEDENDILNKKYADEKLTKQQFNTAQQTIFKKNNEYKNRTPKPTLHFVIPLYEKELHEEIILEKKMNEQEKIIEFCRNIKKFFDKDIGNYRQYDKFVFLKEFVNELIFCMDESIDKEYNWNQFNNRNEEESHRKNYHVLKKKILFYNLYNKKKKITNKLLLENNIFINKTDKESIDKYKLELDDFFKNNEWMLKNNLSFHDYLISMNIIKSEKEDTIIIGNKRIKIKRSNLSTIAQMGLKKSGIKYDLNERNNKNTKIMEKTTIDYNIDSDIDIIFKEFSKNTPIKVKYTMDEFITNEFEHFDSSRMKSMKEKMTKNFSEDYMSLSNTQAFWVAKNTHHISNEMMHLLSIPGKNNSFIVLNAGIQNMMIICATTHVSKIEDGQPFMCVWLTKNPDNYNNVYGKIYKISIGEDLYLCCTNWRRLNQNKLTFLRDTFYMTLSSTMNSLLSAPDPTSFAVKNKINSIYSFRVIVSNATNQKISELLMDTRYAYMSSFSIYTNISKLLTEKFGPPYYTVFELWIVKRLLKMLPKINEKAQTTGFDMKMFEVIDNFMDVNTIGGRLNLPSLWHEHLITDVTDLIDEIFVYVHTMKEPSNIFHENVKALKTIIKFQEMYDELSEKHKYGLNNNTRDIYNFLKKDTQIGCSTGLIIDSVKHTINREKPFFKKIIHDLNDESIGEILSTKAVIRDSERYVVEKKPKKREFKKIKNRLIKIYNDENIKIDVEKIKHYTLMTESIYYDNKARQKVMESVLELLENHKNLNKTVQFANEFIKKNKKVIADICIKSQYGSKREFYVINLGAKTLARVTENFFREICVNSPNEAISIPGDDKILRMQKMLDKVYYNMNTQRKKIVYVNGDCTKWSAAETMSSFLAMCYGFKEKISEKMYNLLVSTYNAWSDKEIQIPMDIYNKVIGDSKFHTNFLNELKDKNNSKIKSTQNFLQGMFNYSSSYKAVCCTNYTIKIWNKIYPETTLVVEHLEHSDDYMLIITYEDEKELSKFRTLQKMIMRLHGYNDSDRKTSVQKYFMEFVSQISFNGVMLYPQIKKSKEVNLSLPCTSYKQDMEAALSRVKECSRVGCNQSFLYFFQKLHIYVVAEAYSVLPGMHNSKQKKYTDLLNTPIELFGLPCPSPIFSLYCRGNINNYRLFKYGDFKTKALIYFLHFKAKEEINNEKFHSDNIDYKYTLKTPLFSYEVNNKTVKKLRNKLNIGFDTINDFWDKNISYKFLKPKNTSDLITWIKCMYYNKSFLEAYNTTSRANMTMRISFFARSKIIIDNMTLEDFNSTIIDKIKKSYTIIEYIEKTYSDFDKDYEKIYLYYESNNIEKNMVIKTITKCDPTPSAIYTFVEKVTITPTPKQKTKTIQVALKTPIKLKTFTIINTPSDILQYIYNKEKFELDKRNLISRDSIEKDMKEIVERIPQQILKSKKTMDVLSVYNDMMINKEKRIVMFGFNRHCLTLQDSIKDILMYNYIPGHYCKVEMTDVMTVLDPLDENKILYIKGVKLTRDFHRQCIDNICLIYTYLNLKYEYTPEKIIKYLNRIDFTTELDNKKISFKYYEILGYINYDYMKTYNYTQEEIKIVCFLKSVLLNENDILDEYSNSSYTFSYKYITESTYSENEYKGKTHVAFTYLNMNCEAVYDRNICDQPILIVNRYIESISPRLYNIALRLVGKITQNEYDELNTQDRIPLLKKEKIKNFEKFSLEQNIIKIIKAGVFKKQVDYRNIENDDFFIPIMITKKTLRKQGDKKYGIDKMTPIANPRTMIVRVNNYRLYILPFWCCNQHNNMIYNNFYNKDDYLDGIFFGDLLKNSIIQKYFTNQLNTTNDKLKINYTDEEKLNFLIKSFSKNKIYNFDYTDIVDTKNKDLYKVITSPVDHFKEYTKNFLMLNDFYVEDFFDKYKENINQLYKNEKMLEPIEKNENIKIELIKNDKNFFEDMSLLNKINDIDDFFIEEEDLYNDNDDFENNFIDENENKFYFQENIIDFKYNIDDDFIVYKPQQKLIKKNEKINYMIRRIINKESLTLIQILFEFDYNLNYEVTILPNLIRQLKNLSKYYINTTETKHKYHIMMQIFKLLCMTFLNPEEYKNSSLRFYVTNNKLIFTKRLTIEYNEEIHNEIIKNKRKKILKYWVDSNNINIDVQIELNEYMNIYKKEIDENILLFKTPKINSEIMKTILLIQNKIKQNSNKIQITKYI